MGQYILSKFNHYYSHGDDVLIFNALVGKLAVVSKKTLDSVKQDDSIERLFKKDVWINNGFLIRAGTDENSYASYQFRQQLNPKGLNLTVMASENCNFRCAYCFDEFQGKNISEETIRNIVSFVQKNLNEYSYLYLNWFGGEPLLAKREILSLSEQLKKICQRSSRSYSAMITTNGFLLDLETFKSLLRNNVFTYIITIDGLARTHNQSRPLRNGQPSFDTIINNLRMIRDRFSAKRFNLQIRTNVTSNMLNDFPAYLDFISKEFGENPNFSFMFSPVYDWGGERVKAVASNLVDSLKEFYFILQSHPAHLSLKDIYRNLVDRVCVYACEGTFTIRPNGELLLCPQLNQHPIGTLSSGKMVIDTYELAKWRSCTSSAQVCMSCSEYNLCEGRNCPARLMHAQKNAEEISCGREWSEVENVVQTLYITDRDLFVRLEE